MASGGLTNVHICIFQYSDSAYKFRYIYSYVYNYILHLPVTVGTELLPMQPVGGSYHQEEGYVVVPDSERGSHDVHTRCDHHSAAFRWPWDPCVAVLHLRGLVSDAGEALAAESSHAAVWENATADVLLHSLER